MSIVRVGMAEDGKFADGYEAIFGKNQTSTKMAKKTAATRKKPAGKSSAKKGAKKR